jgi:CO/xanthine dehydrogenase Mo-binding subunit
MDILSSAIGRSVPRVDGRPKVTGSARFAADVDVRGLLHGRPVLAMPAHARIVSIDASEALAVPGVVAVLTCKDLPITNEGKERKHEPLVREEILWAGQAVALVVAETPEAAADAVHLVHVETTPLPPVINLDTACEPGADRARMLHAPEVLEASAESQHAAVGGGAEQFTPDEDLSENVKKRSGYRRGDVDAALAASDVVVSGHFITNWVHQGYIEPQVSMAEIEPDGTLHVTCATQGTFIVRSELAKIYGLPVAKVRVTGATLGGGFGGKLLVIDPLAAGATLRLGRPVRVELTRNEDFRMSNPAPAAILEVTAGATKDGRLTGIRARLRTETGGFSEGSVEGIAAILTIGPYAWPSHEVVAYGVETNRVATGAYRAPGAPQATFALEQVIDELAARLDLDPIAFRRQNLVQPDDPMADGTAWGGIGLDECLARLADHPLWHERESLPADEGVGLAVGAWPGGRMPASAICRLEADGRVTVITGVVDMSGTMTAFSALAAEGLGIASKDVAVISADTASAPRSPVSGGSMVTYSTGRAIVKATENLREKILSYAATLLEIDVRDLELVDGAVRPKGTPERAITLAQIGDKLDLFSNAYEPLEGHGGSVPPVLAPLTAAHLVHLRVDRETGRAEVLDYVLAQDVGRALNPAIIEGQMHGGATQGLGWALSEAMEYDEGGQLLTGTFLDYPIPQASEVPNFETIIVEVPAPDGPYGAKGIGEGPLCGSAAAVANAMADATGVRFRTLPMTPQRVWRGIREAEKGEPVATA